MLAIIVGDRHSQAQSLVRHLSAIGAAWLLSLHLLVALEKRALGRILENTVFHRGVGASTVDSFPVPPLFFPSSMLSGLPLVLAASGRF